MRSVIADIAVVFHWQPSELLNLPAHEILAWHDEAKKRSQ